MQKKKELENRPEYVFTNYQPRPICANTINHTHTHTHTLKVTRDPLLYTTVDPYAEPRRLKLDQSFRWDSYCFAVYTKKKKKN